MKASGMLRLGWRHGQPRGLQNTQEYLYSACRPLTLSKNLTFIVNQQAKHAGFDLERSALYVQDTAGGRFL